MHGERGDVGGSDDAANGQRGPQLVAALLNAVSEQRCRQRSIDEAGGDEVDAHRCELNCERRCERGQHGGGGGGDPETGTDAPAAGATHQQQRSRRPHLGCGVARDLEPEHYAVTDRLAHLRFVHLEQGSVSRAAGSDHDVVDRWWQVLEELPQGSRIVGVEGCGALRANCQRGLLEPVGISAGQDDVGTLGTGESSRLESDPSAAADHDDGLSGQLRFPRGRN